MDTLPVTSWRATVEEHVQRDFDELTSAALDYALHALGKLGEIYPFAVHRLTDGDTRLSMPTPNDGNEHPLSTDVLDWLVQEAQQNAQEIRAIAIVADLRLEDGADAVRVQLEHRNGHAIDVTARYRKSRFRRTPKYEPLSASVGAGEVWGDHR